MTQDTLTKDIEVSREGAVMSAAFARPQKKNAITGAMYEALIEAFDTAERDPEVGALVMSGKGGVFTAGNDIGDFLAVALHETGEFPAWRFVSKVAEFEKPLIAAIDGLAIGVGTTLCFHCDLVYAAPERAFPDAVRQSRPRARGRVLASCAAALRARQGGGALVARRALRRRSGARARPHQRRAASERADGACDEQGGRARGQASGRPPRDAAPHARRSRRRSRLRWRPRCTPSAPRSSHPRRMRRFSRFCPRGGSD